jgi:hypothetical protein
LSNSNYYQIPPTIAFTTARIKQAVIQNSYNNATNQSYTVTSGNTVITIPIENGYYEGTDYADYLTHSN